MSRVLRSGKQLPNVGFGVYLVHMDEAYKAVGEALHAGFRLIDTASVYLNEKETAQAIGKYLRENKHKVSREDIVYTSKLWQTDFGYEKAIKGIKQSLEKAKDVGYIDLYLMHSPYGGKQVRLDTYKALQEAVERGEIKDIGVSNWGVHHLKELYEWQGLKVEPSVNQIEVNPWFHRQDIIDFCNEKGIIVEAFSPLTMGQRLGDSEVVALAEKYGKTPAQILLRWSIQHGVVPLAKSIKPARMRENLQALDYELSEEDAKELGDPTAHFVTEWDPAEWP